MAKGFRGGFGGGSRSSGGGAPNMQKMMQQAQALQREMEKEQEEIAGMTFEATAGGGAVKVVMTGEKKLQSIEFQPEVVDPDDIEMFQDLIVAAVNEGLEEVERVSQERLGKYTSNLSL